MNRNGCSRWAGIRTSQYPAVRRYRGPFLAPPRREAWRIERKCDLVRATAQYSQRKTGPGLAQSPVIEKQPTRSTILHPEWTGIRNPGDHLVLAVRFVGRNHKVASCNRLWIVAHYSSPCAPFLVSKTRMARRGVRRPQLCGRRLFSKFLGKTPEPACTIALLSAAGMISGIPVESGSRLRQARLSPGSFSRRWFYEARVLIQPPWSQ